MFGLASFLGALPYLAILVAAALTYNGLIENPSIRREARAGYVLETEAAAAKAEAAEMRRQANVALEASVAFNARLVKEQAATAAREAETEQDIADNEKRLKAIADRKCGISPADRQWLLK